jgi:hypothetical protein
VAEGDGLLNADQPLGHLAIPHKSSRFSDLLDRVIWLLLASNGPFWRVTGTIVGTFSRVTVAATEELWCAPWL